ncbi:hypothetical protein HHI36_012396 [Cryptolaemus montrouzieri]|uniref:Ionotropic receptor n=1 Tax=Cryptolaemus montrouzieri TaxID=559131 RepID=A0ABD2NEK3_9CUCU
MDDDTFVTKIITSEILKCTYIPVCLINDELSFNQTFLKQQTSAMLIFINETDLDQLKMMVEGIMKFELYNSRIQTIITICHDVQSLEFLPSYLKTLWSYGIIRFLVILVYDHNLHMFSYNPFKNKINVILDNKQQELFPNYLNNLEGYNLKAAIFPQWPGMTVRNKKWDGPDFNLLKVLSRLLNANITIVRTPTLHGYKAAYESIKRNESDFCIIKYFQASEFPDMEFTAPLELNSVDLYVPNPRKIPTYMAVFMVFEVFKWIVIGGLFLLMVITFKCLGSHIPEHNTWSLCDIILVILSITLNFAVGKLVKFHRVLKILVFPYVLSSLILNVDFQAHLLTRLQFMYYYDGIETIYELARSNLPVYTFVNITEAVPKEMKEQYFIIPSINYREVTQMSTKETAFALPFFRRNLLTKTYGRRTLDYYSLREPLVRGYGVYMFRKNSPYVDKFNQVMTRMKQYALTKSTVSVGSDEPNELQEDSNAERNCLTIGELESVFLILVAGLILSTVIFSFELYFKHKK